MLQLARIEAPDVRPGTHDGAAYEVAARCAAGEIGPVTVRAELIGWEYDKPLASTGYPDVDDVVSQFSDLNVSGLFEDSANLVSILDHGSAKTQLSTASSHLSDLKSARSPRRSLT